MKSGTTIYFNGIKSTCCGLTSTGLVTVKSAGTVLTVRPERVKRKARSDRGGKHRRAA